MLFDLGTGKKKRVIQVIYGMLALLFLVGFVGFGIGGEIGSGGIADIFTGDSDDIEETQFSEDADEIEQQLEDQPRNQELLVAADQHPLQRRQRAAPDRRGDRLTGDHGAGRAGIRARPPTPGTGTSR